MPAQSTHRTPKRRKRIRFPKIFAHADALGVERSHLYRVLTGQRTSASLKRRYEALVVEEAAAR